MAHYVDNKTLYKVMIEFKDAVKDAEAVDDPPPKVPDYVGACLLKIANRLSLKTIFLSFCSNGVDVKKLRSMFNYNVEIISKIESRSAILHLTEICYESDAVLIDRGDLSKEIPIEKIPFIQKIILSQAKKNKLDGSLNIVLNYENSTPYWVLDYEMDRI